MASQDKYNAPFPTNLRAILEERGVTITALANALGISRQAVSQYADGTGQPNADKLTRIADYFGVSTDWLLGRSGGVKAINGDVQIVCKMTGLSEELVNEIFYFRDNMNVDLMAFFNRLFSSPQDFYNLLVYLRQYYEAADEAEEKCSLLTPEIQIHLQEMREAKKNYDEHFQKLGQIPYKEWSEQLEKIEETFCNKPAWEEWITAILEKEKEYRYARFEATDFFTSLFYGDVREKLKYAIQLCEEFDEF